jgi:hypothetical protein
MFYSLLGRTVWWGGKRYLHRRYGATYVPKSMLAGGALAVGAAAAFAVMRVRAD